MLRATLSRCVASLAIVIALAGCDALTPASPEFTTVDFGLENLAVSEASYDLELWLEGTAGRWYRAGALEQSTGAIELLEPVAGVQRVAVAVRAVDEADEERPRRLLLQGGVESGLATLSLIGGVTRGEQELRQRPGQFTIFAPSTGHLARFPHHEESGVWLFNTQPRETDQNDAWVRLTTLSEGWFYEHWVVRDLGTEGEVWLSNGKFEPNRFGVVDRRDHTGWGPFSGVADYETAGEEEFPGADYYANPLGLPFPEELELPLDLTEQTPDGRSRWHYMITIEPSFDRDEPLTEEHPFPLTPYVEPFGTGGPGIPRTLQLREDLLPRGIVILR